MKQIHVNSYKQKSTLQYPNFYCNRGDCRKAFSHHMLLNYQLNLHDNNLIQCHYCPWKGAVKKSLIEHQSPFFNSSIQVLFCQSSFYAADTRNKHETDIHEKISDRYKCDKCPFITYFSWIWHKRENHLNTDLKQTYMTDMFLKTVMTYYGLFGPICIQLWLGLCKLENQISKVAKNAEKSHF